MNLTATDQNSAVLPGTASFKAIGTTCQILTSAPQVLDAALEIAIGHLRAVDLACSRFRPDSEISQLAIRSVDREGWWYASPLLIDYLRAAQHAAQISDGLVDFTVGSAMIASGYDADIDSVRARDGFVTPPAGPAAGWRLVSVSSLGKITTPQGVVLDFGATAKAHAADMIARTLALQLEGGFLVNLGGDIASSGTAPVAGWNVGVEAADGRVRQVVAITDQAVATSSTQLRTWVTDTGRAHHIVDPRTGRVATQVWGQVTCVATTALEANTASTAALVLGADAPAWLEANGVAARLERLDGSAEFTAGWPIPTEQEEDK
jgi:FAD:protein FMN transferase